MTVWHVNTTRNGGGVAEILDALVRCTSPSGPTHSRFVTSPDSVVFEATKRIHHRLHGVDRGALPDTREHAAYLAFAAENAARFTPLPSDGDVVVIHDPQTLPMAPLLVDAGLRVFWRCHIGTTVAGAVTEATWDYLSQFWPPELGLIFSLRALVPPQAAGRRVDVIAPSVDPGALKNRPMTEALILETLSWIGLSSQRPGAPREGFEIFSDGPLDADPAVVQISRWDPLKDMGGVLRAFADSGLYSRAQLILCGPSPASIIDDPEASAVLHEVIRLWEGLPAAVRRRVHLVCTALDDVEGNALLVNALQRRATVIVQRSVQEGFGLTVTEAMLKGRPIVASRVGGIPSQITHGQTGLLLDDPSDDSRFAELITSLLDDPPLATRLGAAAAAVARNRFTTSREVLDHERVLFRASRLSKESRV